MKRMGWVLLLLLFAPALYALDVTAASSFIIKNVGRSGKQIKLPLERKKYYNIRILNKDTFDFVQTCTEPCVQTFETIVPAVQEVRPAKTREDMWLASVAFNRAWLVTFFVFKDGENYFVKSPANFTFLDRTLEAQTHRLVLQTVQEKI